jgi:hypothetical protein
MSLIPADDSIHEAARDQLAQEVLAERPQQHEPEVDDQHDHRQHQRDAPAARAALFDWISYPFRTGSRSLYATRGHRISSLADRLTRFARRRRAHRQSRSLASRLITIAGSQYVLHKAALVDDDHQGLHESPNYWWPEDRTWLVYANVDCPTTYVGGSTTLAQRLLEDDQIEAVPAELDDPLDGHG